MRAGEAGDSTRRNKSFDGANGREPERRYTADTEGERRSVQRVRGRKEGSLTHTHNHTHVHEPAARLSFPSSPPSSSPPPFGVKVCN